MDIVTKEYKLKQRRNSRFAKELRKEATKAEVLLGNYLMEKKVYFIFQKGFLVPFHRIVDFYLPVRSVIVEVDGGYHINTRKKDNYKDTRWRKERYLVSVRLTNEEVYKGDFSKLDKYISTKIEVDNKTSKWPPNCNKGKGKEYYQELNKKIK